MKKIIMLMIVILVTINSTSAKGVYDLYIPENIQKYEYLLNT
jgi:hypothetical protein